MNLDDLYKIGISKTSTRFIMNPLRKILFKIIKPYLHLLLEEDNAVKAQLHTIIQEHKTTIQEHKTTIQKCDSTKQQLYAVSQDLAAMRNRFNTIEFKIQDHFSQICSIRENLSDYSFSQIGEDRIVFYLFSRLGVALKDVKYLDLGAAYPIGSNNTYLFYQYGASGCLVEADPDYFQDYQRMRPRDLAIHAAVLPELSVDKVDRLVEFYKTRDPGWSTASPSHLEIAKSRNKADVDTQSIKVPAMSINEIFKVINYSDNFDLLSVDVEGLDSDIIKEINFSKIRPKIIIVENKFDANNNVFIPETQLFLHQNSYMLFASTYVNSIFVDEAVMESINF